METREWSVSWGALWRIVAMAALVAILFVSRNILVAVLLAIIISSALDPLVTWLQRRHVPRILGTLAIYLLSLLSIAVVIYILVPVALVELNSFVGPDGVIGTVFSGADAAANQFVQDIVAQLNTLTADFLGGDITLLSLLSQFLGGIFITIIIFVISFYLTIDQDGVEKFLITILPPSSQVSVLNIFQRVRFKIGRWFRGQLLLSVIIGFLVFIGLWALGVRYSLLLGITAGIFELVPYVGPIFSGGLAVLLAMTDSVTLGMYAFILFVAIQQLENNFLVPAIMGRSTSLSPVIVLVALLIGWEVFGLIGLILAVPVAVMFQEVLHHWSTTLRHEHAETPGSNA